MFFCTKICQFENLWLGRAFSEQLFVSFGTKKFLDILQKKFNVSEMNFFLFFAQKYAKTDLTSKIFKIDVLDVHFLALIQRQKCIEVMLDRLQHRYYHLLLLLVFNNNNNQKIQRKFYKHTRVELSPYQWLKIAVTAQNWLKH